MRFGLLGPLAVWGDDGEPVAIPGQKVRALLADLLLTPGRVVSADRLAEDLALSRASLHVRVSQLRAALGDKGLIVSRPPGYLVDGGSLDTADFADLVAKAEAAADPRERAELLERALELWRGPALADFADEEFARAAVARLEEQRLSCHEALAEARLELGLSVEVSELVAAHPLRERLRAVQITALYRAGRQGEALAAYQDLRERLADELGLDPGPELAALHQAILRQDPTLSPAPAAPRTAPTPNLPAPLVELVGRETALAEVGELLAGDRLVTLTGSGGVGKTTLAIEAARATARAAWLVELAGLDHTWDLAAHVAATLGLRDDVPLETALRERDMVLVLDNCEHLVDEAADLVRALLRAAPRLTVLATSREPLGLPGEAVWSVPPLDLPDAMRLFTARARVPESEALALLCRRLDGIPLALELAATRARALGVDGLVARLDDRFRLLATGHRGAPPRQQTLTAMIAWSWDLLGEPEQAVLRRLAVHVDGCTLEAAEAVCGVDVLDHLVRLVDRSLVTVVHGPAGPRYRLLESVAAFCADRLREAGELEEVRQRHAEYYTALAERAEVRGSEQRQWLARLDAEAANLRVALAGPHALRLVDALGWYWFLRGRLGEARRAIAAALERGGTPDAVARALAWQAGFAAAQGEAGAAVPYEEIEGPRDRLRARWFTAFNGFNLVAAEDSGSAALSAADFRELGDEWGEAAALILEARDAHVRVDLPALEAAAARAAELFARLGDRWGLLQAVEWQAARAEIAADYAEAMRLTHESVALAEELGLWPQVAERQCWLGWIALQRGAHEEAVELAERALTLAVEQGFQLGHDFAQVVLAFAARRGGRHAEAERRLGELLEPGAVHHPMVLTELGFVAEELGDAVRSLELHRAGYEDGRRLEARRDMAGALIGLAGALALAGRYGEAARCLGTAQKAKAEWEVPASPIEQLDIDRVTAAIPPGFEADFAEGARTDPDEIYRGLEPP
ncbi:BTAD domain-containing putative transcriptional regulator [Nonomuraea sp. NPDC050310]|uniref:BTAD domain-containing putative transcriptional regulator n=1 Tax=Nonomuraea sp. NPDC050310 TaxID=3154935 RepID=UPI00340ACCE5